MRSFAERIDYSVGNLSKMAAGEKTVPFARAQEWAKALKLEGDQLRRFLRLAAVTHLPKEMQADFCEIIEIAGEARQWMYRMRAAEERGGYSSTP